MIRGSKQGESLSGGTFEKEFMEELAFKMTLKRQVELVGGRENSGQREQHKPRE